MNRTWTLLIGLVGVLCAGDAFAAPGGALLGGLGDPAPRLDANTPIEIDAEELDYDRPSGRVTASGNVIITCGVDELRADRVLVNMNSGDAYALGNVVLTRGDSETRATKIQYNFRTRVCSLDDPEVDASPFRVLADKVTRAGRNEYVLHRAKVTTCVFKHPHSHYHVRAKRITVVPGEYMKTRGAVWFFGPVPCMYFPYWYRNLAEDAGFRFYPGYRSKMGAYLLSSYHHRLSPHLRAEHHLDYRSRRGVAFGEDLKWNAPDWSGKLRLYYLDDKEPTDTSAGTPTSEIDSQRYRIYLQHNQTLGPRTLMLTKLNYLSDSDILRDFFDREYRASRQPENYVSLSHRRTGYTLTALANTRINDFYSNVNRLPELSADVMRLQLGSTSFYYEGQTTLAQLERVWAEGSTTDDYSALRLDTEHMIYQPRRYLGWLNVVPRAGYRGTYYSETLETQSSQTVVTSTTTNTTVEGGVTNSIVSTVTTTNTSTAAVDAGAQLRNLFELGAEVSFKAFKTMDTAGGPRRHIVEPYANYTFRLEPNVLPADLYQFDSVDQLGELHQTVLGVRNKIQSKNRGRPFDLADIDVYTVLKFHTTGGEDVFERIYLDAEFRPTSWLALDIDGIFDVVDSELDQFNTRFDLARDNTWKARVEHRYRVDSNSLLSGLVTFYPSSRWAFNLFGRYEFEASRLEEQGGYIQRKLDCIGIRLGGSMLPGYTRTDGTVQEDEYRVMLEFWLTAFPELTLRSRQKY